jgi:hypothetical protein
MTLRRAGNVVALGKLIANVCNRVGKHENENLNLPP